MLLRIISISILCLAFIASCPKAFAQDNCPCCKPEHALFDFWVGNWIVKDTLGTVLGQNRITKIDNNCALQEKWTGTSGSTGSSLNFYDPNEANWNQIWVDNNGGILRLQGTFSSGKMQLQSELTSGGNGDYYNRITWWLNENGTVTQLWEQVASNGKSVNTVFKGIYHRAQD